MKPDGATHQEVDGTYWRCVNGNWSWWNKDDQKWRDYVGPINTCFLAIRTAV